MPSPTTYPPPLPTSRRRRRRPSVRTYVRDRNGDGRVCFPADRARTLIRSGEMPAVTPPFPPRSLQGV